MQKVPADVVSALRNGTEIANLKLQALHVFTARINAARGNVTQAEVDAFLAAGYTKANILKDDVELYQPHCTHACGCAVSDERLDSRFS